MSKRPEFRNFLLCALLACASLAIAQQVPKQKLDRLYQSAVADYDAGRYAEAAAALESVLPYATKSFEVHELLGMVYASMPDDAKAVEQLKIAAQLRPDSAAARTNLGAALLHAGKSALAGEQFREALRLEPHSYDANHNLGEFYIRTGHLAEARPLLEAAQRLQPDSYENSYDLAMTDFQLGQLDAARETIQLLVKKRDAAELHNLLAQVEEKSGNYVAAANEYEKAAHMDPSEDNLFDWGSEMLLHRTYEPAIAIFQQGVQRYPKSPRLLIGLGLSLYSRGKYDSAVKALLAAAALTPSDARCYLFLSKAYDSSPKQADEVIQAFKHYAELEPQNARAQYYYAMSLWKGKRVEDGTLDLKTIQALLEKSIALDDTLPEAHVQLGDLYSDQHNYTASIPEYERALQLNPNLSDAHYRLATDYVHVGKRDRAKQEFAIYQKLRAEHLAEVEKERAEVRQFVYSAKALGSEKQ